MSEPVLEQRPRIDSFLVADFAQSINGKLYLMGGGFNTIGAAAFPLQVAFFLGAILKVPWNDTNRRLPIEATVETEEREPLGWNMQGEVEAGRAPGARGSDVSIVMAAPVAFEIAEPGPFQLRVNFAGDERVLSLEIVPAVAAPAQ
jgi:hypothetical protein